MIPKYIHQVWIGPNPIPPHCSEFAKQMRAMNSDWKYILWNNKNSIEGAFKNDPLIKEWKKRIGKDRAAATVVAERIRFLALYYYGGIYADIDCKPIQPFNNLMKEVNEETRFFGGSKTQDDTGSTKQIIDCSLVGSSPRSNVCHEFLRMMEQGYKPSSWCLLFSQKIMDMMEDHNNEIQVFDREYFYSNRVNSKSIVLHDTGDRLWSWRGGEPLPE